MNPTGLIPIVSGGYMWFYATGRVGAKPDDPRYIHWMKTFGPLVKWLSVSVVLFGVVELFFPW
jgi:hypothetical protein